MIGILAEKPSQAKNFAKALGGVSGTYNGQQYVIAASHGHLYEFKSPDVQVPDYKQWALSGLPWDESRFNWNHALTKGSSSTASAIKSAFRDCDEIAIATDVDPSGEGFLLAAEILINGKFHPKNGFSRMYFDDEFNAKQVRDAFVNRKKTDIYNDKEYRMAFFRARWDFLSMQFTRAASICGGGNSVLRQGRLKSAIVVLVGDQLKLVKEYKKIPSYSNRFKDENGVVYKNADATQYKTKEEVPQNLHDSAVVQDSKTMKHTAPPKLMDLSMLSAALSKKGYRAKEVLDDYQNLYEAAIVSYPRTEDKTISNEQFQQLLPLADKIAAVVGVDASLLTHKTPRSTHVKDGGVHGANRPGMNVPGSLSELSRYGKSAPAIYELLARNYLAMLCEDYEYEQQKAHVADYPEYKGTCNVPKSMGYRQIFSTGDDADEEDNGKGTGMAASPFVHEGFPPKPKYPDMDWLMKQLGKRNIGTGATKTSTYSDVTNPKYKYPLLNDSKGKISMTEFGEKSYVLLQNTNIGDLSVTERIMGQMKEVSEGKNPDDFLYDIRRMVKEDIKTMQDNANSAGYSGNGGSQFPQKEKVSGMFRGKEVKFSREWSGHRFTDDEVDELLAGNEITIEAVGKNGPYKCKGILDEGTYNGHKFFGFQRTGFVNDGSGPKKEDHYYGKFNGKDVHFKRIFRGKNLTDEQCEQLLSGMTIEITGLTAKSSGNTYGVKAKLNDELEYNGHKYCGVEQVDFL